MPSAFSPQPSLYWHDYETSGTDPRRDRVLQFAGQRTTLDLQPIGEAQSIYCKPATDNLPQPAACLITGIAPQLAQREGLIEAEFAAHVHDELAQPGTCGVGYNSIRFDDEFTRNLLYRNFHDPYEREWKSGNARWDIIDLARLCYALRPHGIEWPGAGCASPGAGEISESPQSAGNSRFTPSFKLVDLAAANHLTHSRAHDALSDVEATIAFARLLRTKQPRLWDFYFDLRRKQRALELLDYTHRTPVLHVSSRYPAQRGCLAMVVPLAQHPSQPNKIIVYDLDTDPQSMLDLDADDIADRLFTPRRDLPDDVQRIPLKAVAINKSPALAPLTVLKDTDTTRIGLDPDRCLNHLRRLNEAADLVEKLRAVFATQTDDQQSLDAELAIYRGFVGDADKRLMSRIRSALPHELVGFADAFHDPRYPELLFRYRARNFPQTLKPDEHARWSEFRRARLTRETALTSVTAEAYFAEIAAARADASLNGEQRVLLDQLESWGHHLIDA